MKFTIVLLSLVLGHMVQAAEMRLSLDVGEGNLAIDKNVDFDVGAAGDNAIYSGLHFDYFIRENIPLEFGINSLTDDFLFGANDNVHFDSFELLAGYQFQSGDLYFEPKIGLSHWALEVEEGAFLNPGSEQKFTDDGISVVVKLSLGYQFSQHFDVNLDYRYQDYDRGQANVTFMGLSYRF